MVFVQGGFAMRQYIPDLMPLIVDALLDGAAVTKREVAVSTLGQVVQSTGYVACFLCYTISLRICLRIIAIVTLFDTQDLLRSRYVSTTMLNYEYIYHNIKSACVKKKLHWQLMA